MRSSGAFRVSGVVMVALVVMGLFLRLYQRDAAMYYMNDQGQLLIIAREIIANRHVPLAGPPISLASGSIPPLHYYLVAAFVRFGSDPLAVSLGYLLLSMFSGVGLWYYATLRYGHMPGLVTLAVSMLSAAMVELGRSMWEPHPMVAFIVWYVLLTEIACRRNNLWLYGAGVLLYVLALASYPAPLLLLPYVIARASGQMRSFGVPGRFRVGGAIVLIGGLTAAVLAPWALQTMTHSPSTAKSVVVLMTSFVSLREMIVLIYANTSTVFHDLFGLSVALPESWVGAWWLKIVAGTGVIAGILTFRKKEIRTIWQAFIGEQYHWLALGFLAPASFGMKLMPHRLLPFYPFVCLFLGWLAASWISRGSLLRRLLISMVIVVFVVGNAVTWWTTTMRQPRQDYVRTQRAAIRITEDMKARGATKDSVGVHYFRPDDQYDFFGAHLYYLLRVAVQYPVSFRPLGNALVRDNAEDHDRVYLVCDGFSRATETSGCLQPFFTRWSHYILSDLYRITEAETVFAFDRL